MAEVAHYMRTESEDQARIGATLDVASTRRTCAKGRNATLGTVVALAIVAAVSAAPKVSPQQADAFARKLAIISAQPPLGARRARAARPSPRTRSIRGSPIAPSRSCRRG